MSIFFQLLSKIMMPVKELTPTAVAAADPVLSECWYLLAVIHGAWLCACALLQHDTLYSQTPLVYRQCG